jgi:transcriptional regulator with XRE-family HTH domain
MDMDKAKRDHGVMPQRTKPTRNLRQRPARRLFIGEWIRGLGMKQIDVVRRTGMNEGYLSELCSGRSRKVPGSGLLADIAESLGIPVDYLYRMPPDQDFVERAASLDPNVLARLRPTRN